MWLDVLYDGQLYAPTKKLLVFDLDDVLVGWTKDSCMMPAELSSVSCIGRFYNRRPSLGEFLVACKRHFNLAIWSLREGHQVQSIMSLLFDETERKMFEFVFDRSNCMDTGLIKMDRRKVKTLGKYRRNGKAVYLKCYEDIQFRTKFAYDRSNIVFIDSRPYCTWNNLPWQCIHPKPYYPSDGLNDDNFLMGILLPWLKPLKDAHHVRLYISLNEPKWSIHQRSYQAYVRLRTLREELERDGLVRKDQFTLEPSRFPKWMLPRFPIWSLSTGELVAEQKDAIANLPRFADIRVEEMQELAWKLNTPLLWCHPSNIESIKTAKRMLLKLVRQHCLSRDWICESDRKWRKCNRDLSIDPLGVKKTCSNYVCPECEDPMRAYMNGMPVNEESDCWIMKEEDE